MIGYFNFPKEYQELYDSLNSEYLLYCVENGKEEEWNEKYDSYLNAGVEYFGLDRNTAEYPELFSRKFETVNELSQPLLMRPNLQDIQIPAGKKLRFKGLHLEGADFSGVTLKNVEFEGCFLSGSTFRDAKLSNVIFYKKSCLNYSSFTFAILRNVGFYNTSIEYSSFNFADMKSVILMQIPLGKSHFKQSNLTNCRIQKSNISACDFSYACIDSTTRIIDNNIDELTDFTGVGLSGICMDEDAKVILESNIRRIHWNNWYQKEKIRIRKFSKKTGIVNPKSIDIDIEGGKNFYEIGMMTPRRKLLKAVERIFIDIPVAFFWMLSDYGSSTTRILLSFVTLNLLSFEAYFLLQLVGFSPSVLSGNLIQMLLQAFLIPFGVGEFDLVQVHPVFLIVMFIQVIGGYVILAALVTRLAVLFQNRSP